MHWGTTIVCAAIATAQLIVAAPSDQRVIHSHKKNNMTHVHERLAKAEIIPTVLDDFKPFYGLSASWKHEKVKLGNTINPSNVKKAPSVHLEKAEADSDSQLQISPSMTHVLALTDPDAPSRDDPKWSEFCHWIATGVSVSSSSGASVLKLKDLVEYKPPGPPPKTGKHRYVFIAFVPANGTTDGLNLEKPKDRKHWGADKEGYGVRQWAQHHGLIPIAANFVYAQNDKQ